MPTLATALPPGWIEVAAFDGEGSLRAFLDAQMDVDAELFSPEHRTMVQDGCSLAFSMVRDHNWLHLGAVVSYLPDKAGDFLTTVWTVGVGLMQVPKFGDLNPIGVAERVLGRHSSIEQVEPFRLEDGRDGVVLAATTSFDPADLDFDPTTYMPQLRPDKLGIYIVLLPVVDLPGYLGVTVGVAPNVAERDPMSFLAAQMATSLRVADPQAMPADRVLIDATRKIHPAGFLTGPPEPSEGVVVGGADDRQRR